MKNAAVQHRRAASAILAVTALCSPATLAATAADDDSVRKAIRDAKVLPVDSLVTIGEDSNTGKIISVYQDQQSNEKDFKIDAILITKAAMGSDNSIARVTVHFFSPERRLYYRSISITSGDIKAFGSGAEGKEQLLSSLVLSPEQRLSAASGQLGNMLQSMSQASAVGSLKSTVDEKTVHISGTLGALMDADDYRYVALQLAERAALALPSAENVEVQLSTGSGNLRSTKIAVGEIRRVESSLTLAMSEINITNGPSKTDGASSETVPTTPRINQLSALIESKLQQLKKDRVGIGSFEQLRRQADQVLDTGKTIEAEKLFEKLNSALDTSIKQNKERQQSGGQTTAGSPAKKEGKSAYPSFLPPQSEWKYISGDTYAGGFHIETERLDSDPAGYLFNYDKQIRLRGQGPNTLVLYRAFLRFGAVRFAQRGDWEHADIFLKAMKDMGIVPNARP